MFAQHCSTIYSAEVIYSCKGYNAHKNLMSNGNKDRRGRVKYTCRKKGKRYSASVGKTANPSAPVLLLYKLVFHVGHSILKVTDPITRQ